MAEKYGIEALKSVLSFGITIGQSLSSDLADKKLSLTEIIGLVPQFLELPNLVAQKDEIINEAKDLSLDEVKELVGSFNGVITNENLVGTIEDILTLVVAAKNVIERFTSKPDAATTATAAP